jgi:hypothetical protein
MYRMYRMYRMNHMCRVLFATVALAAGLSEAAHAAPPQGESSVACWGNNNFGQCDVPSGIGTPENPVASVAAGEVHTVALLTDGSVACWGNNNFGQCTVPSGIGTPENPVASVAAGSFHTVALLTDGSVACWGSNDGGPYDYGQCNVPSGIGTPENPVASVAAGGYHTVAVLTDGSVACWGNNCYGQCNVPSGIGTPENPVASVAAGRYHTVALTFRDCNDNGVDDFVDIWQGTAEDCDGNGRPDACDLGVLESDSYNGIPTARNRFVFETADLTAIDPLADAVTVTVQAVGEFATSSEFLTVFFDGGFLGFAFNAGGLDCVTQTATFEIPRATWEAAAADGNRAFEIYASPAVDPAACPASQVSISVAYLGVPIDCNANGVWDTCDIAAGNEADDNTNGIPDACDLARGDLDLDGCVGPADLGFMLSLWGIPNSPVGDLDGDGVIGASDLGILLANWDC